MKKTVRSKIKDSTQDAVLIKDIIDDLVLTKNGQVSLILQTTAVNFDLLAEHEQDNKIMAFAGLINSLTFPIEILVLTHPVNISNYIDYLNKNLSTQTDEKIKKQMSIYKYFVENMIVQNEVLDKKFYIVISYAYPLSTGGSAQMHRVLEQGKIYLYPKRDHILRQLNRMGLLGHQLTTDELIELFYNIYNKA
jgi:hypothetical protein